jgi:predicted ArsR family transcriptional regulator
MGKREKHRSGRARTWRNILVQLCGGRMTANELAQVLGISAPAVRGHLGGLGDEGLVRHRVERRGVGKPTHVYELTPEALATLSKAYVPVLDAVLEVIATREGGNALEELLGEAGRILAVGGPPVPGSVSERAEAAAAELEKLGGVVDVVAVGSGFTLQGRCCPLGTLSPRFPALCTLVERMLRELSGLDVHESCDRGLPPRCRFDIV